MREMPGHWFTPNDRDVIFDGGMRPPLFALTGIIRLRVSWRDNNTTLLTAAPRRRQQQLHHCYIRTKNSNKQISPIGMTYMFKAVIVGCGKVDDVVVCV